MNRQWRRKPFQPLRHLCILLVFLGMQHIQLCLVGAFVRMCGQFAQHLMEYSCGSVSIVRLHFDRVWIIDITPHEPRTIMRGLHWFLGTNTAGLTQLHGSSTIAVDCYLAWNKAAFLKQCSRHFHHHGCIFS